MRSNASARDMVAPLRSSKRDGTPYQRRPDVEAEITRALARPQAEWVTLCHGPGRLSNEAIVFLVRRTVNQNRDVCGQLIQRLGRSIAAIAHHWAQGFDPITTEEILWQVEMEVIELVLAATPNRQTEFLEIAFGKGVERRTINAVEKRKNAPLPQSLAPTDDQDDTAQAESPEARVADEQPDPEQIALHLDDKVRRRELINKARMSVRDPRHLEAVILRHVYGWPITHKDETKPTLAKHFNKSEKQIRNCGYAARKVDQYAAREVIHHEGGSFYVVLTGRH
jgi:hypothetical protein